MDQNKPKKNLVELMNETDSAFENFIYCIFYSNPNKDTVRIILDDGGIRTFIRRQKFIEIISQLINFNDTESFSCLAKIKSAINSYGKWFLYDRNSNEVTELSENIDYEHIRPQDLLDETRKNATNPDKDRYNNISKQYHSTVMNIKNNVGLTTNGSLNKFNRTIRNFNTKGR